DCGTYGALDEVCARHGLARLRGAHCYEVFAGPLAHDLIAEEPGTYLLTDHLVRAFDRSVVAELGLDRYPELRDAYFGNYRRVVWLAQSPTAELRARAERAARLLGPPLTVLPVGDAGLERELAALLAATGPAPRPRPPAGRTAWPGSSVATPGRRLQLHAAEDAGTRAVPPGGWSAGARTAAAAPREGPYPPPDLRPLGWRFTQRN